MHLFPNPASDYIQVYCKHFIGLDRVQFVLHDLLGRAVFTAQVALANGATNERLDISTVPAVYVARSLYHTKEWVDFKDMQICNAFQERMANPNKEVMKTVEIFPNLSQGEFTLTWTEDDSAILTILDAQGRNFHNQTVQKGQNTIQTKNMSSGIYFYYITNTAGVNSQGKLVILDK